MLKQSVKYQVVAYQVPSLTLDALKFSLVHEGNDALWGAGVRVEFKVQGDDVGRFVAEVIEAVKELEDDLEQIVTRPEGKHGM